jgi:hypothetical protein
MFLGPLKIKNQSFINGNTVTLVGIRYDDICLIHGILSLTDIFNISFHACLCIRILQNDVV